LSAASRRARVAFALDVLLFGARREGGKP